MSTARRNIRCSHRVAGGRPGSGRGRRGGGIEGSSELVSPALARHANHDLRAPNVPGSLSIAPFRCPMRSPACDSADFPASRVRGRRNLSSSPSRLSCSGPDRSRLGGSTSGGVTTGAVNSAYRSWRVCCCGWVPCLAGVPGALSCVIQDRAGYRLPSLRLLPAGRVIPTPLWAYRFAVVAFTAPPPALFARFTG
jgi:hypothetical protein